MLLWFSVLILTQTGSMVFLTVILAVLRDGDKSENQKKLELLMWLWRAVTQVGFCLIWTNRSIFYLCLSCAHPGAAASSSRACWAAGWTRAGRQCLKKPWNRTFTYILVRFFLSLCVFDKVMFASLAIDWVTYIIDTVVLPVKIW